MYKKTTCDNSIKVAYSNQLLSPNSINNLQFFEFLVSENNINEPCNLLCYS